MSKATINDVARLAGVSIKTVSRVINNEPNVSDSTREKVRVVVEQLDYRPSPSARRLASNRSFLIALLYDNPSANYIMNVQQGVLDSCKEHSYDLLIHPCDYQADDLDKEIGMLLRKSRVDGVILTPPLSDMNSVIDVLKEQSVPYSLVAPTTHDNDQSSVYCDDEKAAFQMTEYLISQGHKKIGFVEGHPNHGASKKRLCGFEKALEKNKITIPQDYIQKGFFDHESGMNAGRAILQLDDKPSVIFASNDDMAAGVIHAANSLEIKVPQELSVVGFDDSPVSTQLWPPLTTIKQPIEAMAHRASDLLLDSLKGVKNEETHSFDCELIMRRSVIRYS